MTFVMSAVEPCGVYALSQLATQKYWVACFNGGTKAFAVKPGVVTFVGALDPQPTLNEIAEQLPRESRRGQIHYLLDTPRPQIAGPDGVSGSREALTAYLAKNLPGVTAPVETPEMQDTTFDHGSMLGSAICERY